MTRRGVLATVAALALATAIGIVLWGTLAPAPSSSLEVAGDVRATENVVRAPAVTVPTPDYTVGLPAAPGAKPGAPRQPVAATSSRGPVISGRLLQVFVTEGEAVTRGQRLAVLDTAMLELGVGQARAAATRAHANVDVMSNNLAKLATARATLRTTRAKLVSTLATLIAGRANLAAKLAQLQALPGASGPPVPSASPTAPPSPAVLVAQLRIAIAKMDAGIAKLKIGLVTIGKGSAKLATTRTQLIDARALLRILAKGQDVGIRVAEARLDAATIVSPVDGLVLYARSPGAMVMVGTPLFRIRPDAATLVDTYLTPEQLATIRIGTSATVDWDSNAGAPASGSVSAIGTTAQFPPTSFPTTVVHMTRTVRVTLTLDPGATAPPGTPVDIALNTD